MSCTRIKRPTLPGIISTDTGSLFVAAVLGRVFSNETVPVLSQTFDPGSYEGTSKKRLADLCDCAAHGRRIIKWLRYNDKT